MSDFDISSYCKAIQDIVNGEFDWEQAKLLETILNDNKGPIKDEDEMHSYVYFLLDPKRLHDLFKVSPESGVIDLKKFIIFILAIFYCGKGKHNRLFDHEKIKFPDNDKEKKILDIEKTGQKAAVCQFFCGLSDTEAETRESILIETLGLGNLTNIKRGHYVSPVTLSLNDRLKLGAYWLYKAFIYFSLNGTTRPLSTQVKSSQVKNTPMSTSSSSSQQPSVDIVKPAIVSKTLDNGDDKVVPVNSSKNIKNDFPNKKKKTSKFSTQSNTILNYFKAK